MVQLCLCSHYKDLHGSAKDNKGQKIGRISMFTIYYDPYQKQFDVYGGGVNLQI